MSYNDSLNTGYRTDAEVEGQRELFSTETKAATTTTEFIAYLAAVAAVAITALVVGQDENTGSDPFSALDALRYITYLTIGYMLARGLAKAGSRADDRR
jgi:hypothetical protein